MIRFNTDAIKTVSDSTTKFYENSKALFPALRKFVDNAGDNEAATAVTENAVKLETVFNDDILAAFTTYQGAVTQYCENTEIWENAMKTMDPISGAAVASVEVQNKVKPVEMK